MFSKLLQIHPKLLAQSNAKNLRLAFTCVYVSKHLWEIFIILRNLWCIRDFGDLPPPEYEIPPNGPEMALWKNECALERKKCEYHFFLTIYEFTVISVKLFTNYYPKVWGKTGQKATGMLLRALWFITIDHAVTNVGVFFCKIFIVILVAARHGSQVRSLQEEADSIAKPGAGKDGPFSDFKGKICGVVVYGMFGLTGIAWIAVLIQVLDALFYRKFEFEKMAYTQIAKSALPGCKGIIELANQMGFFNRGLLLDSRDNHVPEAIHHNFISSDIIVISKSLLEKLPPNQSKSVVGHAMIHWKAGYCYWDHLGHLVSLCTKLCICIVSQDVPSFFNIEGEVHPAVVLSLVYTVVLSVVDDILNGIAGWIHARQVFSCDESIEDAHCSLVYLKQALVRLADLPGSQKFDGWYSSWFLGQPSLIDRITRIRRRN